MKVASTGLLLFPLLRFYKTNGFRRLDGARLPGFCALSASSSFTPWDGSRSTAAAGISAMRRFDDLPPTRLARRRAFGFFIASLAFGFLFSGLPRQRGVSRCPAV